MKKAKWDTLDDILENAWAMLERGADRFNDPFHWPVLGTRTRDGCSLRTVILRRFIRSERVLACHTDARATKAQEISTSSTVSWLFYHPKKKIQLRISGKATLHTDDGFADDQWSATRVTGRLDYCATQAPGSPVDGPSSGLPDFLRQKVPTLLESERGRKNFMVITCRIDSMDWLQLRIVGHRRARFDWSEDALTATWLIP